MTPPNDKPSPHQRSFSLGTQGEPIEGDYAVARVTFHNPDNDYAVVQLTPADSDDDAIAFTAVGALHNPEAGACYRIQGTWHIDPRFGPQVRLSSAIPQAPTTLAAIERYLAGASIKGLGPHYARLVVQQFGEEILKVLDEGGARLREVPGIGPVRARQIQESWAEHQGIHELMANLQGVAGLTPGQAQRIYRELGSDAWQAITSDPYLLAEQVRGFGFKTCDRIGRSLGLDALAPQRLQAGLLHALSQALDDGHLWTAPDDLLAQAAELLDAPPELLAGQLEALIAQGRATRVNLGPGPDAPQGIYLRAAAQAEERIARRLAAWLDAPPAEALQLTPRVAEKQVAAASPGALTDDQRRAIVRLLCGQRLVVLTGGPGTGKTTTMRTLIRCLEAFEISYALCATTGRASKQLADTAERPAATVHRHLGIGFGPEAQEAQPVRETVLIIDEASMIDLWLMDQIVERLAPHTHLFLVGDVDQLPPVGPGAVLQDLIALAESRAASGLEVVRLDTIFRQEAGDRSLIVVNCHRVRGGQRPLAGAPESSDYYEMLRATPQEARDLIVELAAERLPRYLGVPPAEVQVLSPMHGGDAGVQALNAALQARLNPPAPSKQELSLGRGNDGPRLTLRVGDKVRQTRNDYRKGVFNGDLGVIAGMNREEQTIQVRFDDQALPYTLAELDDLVHAWAMTVHAAQGSQWPAVVIALLTSHYVMLERNILYTALSRARRLAVLVTQERAVRTAIQRSNSTARRTGLTARMAGQTHR
jgi:exodeoxyribonuclease V alpha subunit